MPQSLESIFSIAPPESGGVVGRRGYLYQDHIATAFCIQMLSNAAGFHEVWCETHDDITLIFAGNLSSTVTAEFVQVKSGNLSKVWSVSDLCKQPAKAKNKPLSILQRSLIHDCSTAKALFRVVTRSGVDDQLKVLTMPLPSAGRTTGKMNALSAELKKRTDPFKSPNGNDAHFWASNCTWQCTGDIDQLQSNNREELQETLEEIQGTSILVRHVRVVYERILKIAQAAAVADWNIDPEKKKLKKSDVVAQVHAALQEALGLGPWGAGQALRKKMESASLSEAAIQTAQDQRIHYLRELYTPKYLSASDHRFVDAEVLV